MADAGAIPERFTAEILRRSGERESMRDIAAWLATQGVTVSHHSVARLLKGFREERQETARAIVAEKLGSPDGLSADIDGIIKLRSEAEEVRLLALEKVRESPGGFTIGAWATAAREYREVTKLALEIAGLSKPDDSSAITDAAERVSGRIAGLIASAGAGASPSEPEPN